MIDSNVLVNAVPFIVVGMAFAKQVRYEMLKRDRWTCQNGDCVGYYFGESPLCWRDGWNVNGAHYPDKHQIQEDRNIENGRCLCVHCHIIEEIDRGNDQGAMKLWQFQTIRNKEWIESNGWKDQKPSFFWYMDWSRADELGKQGLAQAYLENIVAKG